MSSIFDVPSFERTYSPELKLFPAGPSGSRLSSEIDIACWTRRVRLWANSMMRLAHLRI